MPWNARQNLTSSVQPLRRPKLVAVIPAFNEQDSIAAVVAELRAVTGVTFELELVVVDDGSTDRTRKAAQDAGAPVVPLAYNMGIGLAVQTGFRYALAHGADWVVQVDGDGQHMATEIEKLIPPLMAGEADVVVGTRFSQGQEQGEASTTAARWLAGRLLAFSVRLLTGRRLTDTTSGFRVYNRAAAEFIAHDYPDDYPEVQVLVQLVRRGFRVAEVPVRMRMRAHGHSSINWWRSIYYVVKVLLASFMDKVRR